MMKKIFSLFVLIFSATNMVCGAVAYNATASDNWTSPSVWTGGTVPPGTEAMEDNIYIYNGATVTVNTTIVTNARITAGRSSGDATLALDAGADLTVYNRFYAGDRSNGNVGTFRLDGGSMHMIGGSYWNGTQTVSNYSFNIASAQTTFGARGRALINSGTLSFEGTQAYAFSIGANNSTNTAWAVATFSQTGGTVTGSANLSVANNAVTAVGKSISSQVSLMGGTFSISGGASLGNNAVTALDTHIAMTVSSNMDVARFGGASTFAGADTKVIFDVAQRSNWEDKTILSIGGTLTINGAAGVVVDLSNFGLWEGADVGDTVTITLLSYNSLSKTTSTADTITGLDTDHFSAGNITWGANAATIDVTYTNAIPEPAVAAGALGLLALAMAVRRRRV